MAGEQIVVDRHGRARVELTSTAPAPVANPANLRKTFIGDAVPRQEQFRTYFGKSLDLQRIETAIRNANHGFMRPMADLAREQISLDGHVSSLQQKRLNRIAALDWDVTPAAGKGIDEGRAEEYAQFVRQQLEQIPNFHDRIIDLAWADFDGRAASEIEWMRLNGEWHVKDLHWIHPRRLSFGPNRDLRVVDTSRELGHFRDVGFPLEEIPYKFVVHKPRMFGDYQEREGLAPRAIYWSFFIRFGTRERLALLELFGKPWRIVMPEENVPINEEELEDAFASVERLGAMSTARLPRRLRVQVEQIEAGAGQTHEEAIEHAMLTLSKLFLGSTGTTDAVSTGLGSSIGDAHLSEEDLLIASSARRIDETIEDGLTDSIIITNFGPDAVSHAPKFAHSTEPPLDSEKEGQRIEKSLSLGVPVALEEAREKMRVREVKPGEPVLQLIQPPTELGQAQPPPRNAVVYPVGQAPPPGSIQADPDAELALPGDPGGDPQLPPGQPPPPALPTPGAPAVPEPTPAPGLAASNSDVDEAIASLAQKMTESGIARCEHGHSNRCHICGIERVRDFTLDDDGQPVWAIEWRPIPKVVAPQLAARTLQDIADATDLLNGEGGMHQHTVDRELEKTGLAGVHQHVFEIDGIIFVTAEDGAHAHSISDFDDDETGYDGAHFHRLPNSPFGPLDTEVGGEHHHELGVSISAVDGSHTHEVKLPDGRVIRSMTPSEFFEAQPDDSPGLRDEKRKKRKSYRSAREIVAAEHGEHVCFAAQPESTFGSPETLVERGVRKGASAMKKLGEEIGEAVSTKVTARTIRNAIDSAAKGFDLSVIADPIERELLHGGMLGALDVDFEAEEETEVAVERFSDLHSASASEHQSESAATLRSSWLVRTLQAETDTIFASRPLDDAIRSFVQLEVLSEDAFEKLTEAAKRQAFTVARLAREELVRDVKRELLRQLAVGADLRTFRKFMNARLVAAGWVPANPSHVETIFRTNVVRAYNGGRVRQMTQPSVLKARPFWQILTANDGSPRQRPNHRKAHGRVLRADDEFWQKAFPPFGYNCRCRVRNLGPSAADRVSSASDLRLPDKGFRSGRRSLL